LDNFQFAQDHPAIQAFFNPSFLAISAVSQPQFLGSFIFAIIASLH
jgi:hypothetical protein